MFKSIGADKVDLQEIQLDSSVGPLEANIQILGTNRKCVSYYSWLDAATAFDFGLTDGTKGAWVNEDMSPIEPAVLLASGDGVQIDISADKTITAAGQVSDDDITYTTKAGYNFIGNAYPTGLDIQNIVLDAEVGPLEANLQVLGTNRKCVAYYSWLDAATAFDFGLTDGTQGAWVNEDMSAIDPTVSFEPGQGVQVDITGNKTITTIAPIEL